MHLPSLDNLRVAVRDSLARFPFVLFAAAVAAFTGVVVIDSPEADGWLDAFMAAQLGIPFLFAIAVVAGARAWATGARLGAVLAAAIALVIYGVALPGEVTRVSMTRHAQFTVGLHLLVAVAPFAGIGLLNGFWQYNRSLFIRFCLSALYSAVLYLGLALALLGIDKLLGVRVDETLYPRLWVVIAVLFNTWVFVGGVPRDILLLDGVTDYTKGVRVLAQYILVPLVMVYLTILTIYLGKVIVTRVWPSGWIGYMVSGVAVVGILAHLLVHPMREDIGNQWVRTYSRWYYVAMLPAIVMLLLAVGKRIAQYGVTENRYLLAVMAAWLALISLYFAISRARNIKLIPMTLCVLAFGTSFGPWGAFAVSQRSQLNRLTGLLERNGILVDGSVQAAPEGVSFDDRKEIGAVLEYLVDTHRTESVSPWFGDRWAYIDSVATKEGYYGPGRRAVGDIVRLMMAEMEMEYVARWRRLPAGREAFTIVVDPDARVFRLGDADQLVRFSTHSLPVEIEGPTRKVDWDGERDALLLLVEGDTLAIDMSEWAHDLLHRLGGAPGYKTMSAEQARLEAEDDHAHAIVYVQSVDGRADEGAIDIGNVTGMCFLRWIE